MRERMKFQYVPGLVTRSLEASLATLLGWDVADVPEFKEGQVLHDAREWLTKTFNLTLIRTDIPKSGGAPLYVMAFLRFPGVQGLHTVLASVVGSRELILVHDPFMKNDLIPKTLPPHINHITDSIGILAPRDYTHYAVQEAN